MCRHDLILTPFEIEKIKTNSRNDIAERIQREHTEIRQREQQRTQGPIFGSALQAFQSRIQTVSPPIFLPPSVQSLHDRILERIIPWEPQRTNEFRVNIPNVQNTPGVEQRFHLDPQGIDISLMILPQPSGEHPIRSNFVINHLKNIPGIQQEFHLSPSNIDVAVVILPNDNNNNNVNNGNN